MQKLFLSITFLSLLFGGNTYAENIFKCKIETAGGLNKLEYIIKVDDEERTLADLNVETGKFDGTSNMINPIYKGELIKFSNGGNSEVFNMIVFKNATKGSGDFFTAIYYKDINGYRTEIFTIRINTWVKNNPITVYNHFDNLITEGTCE